MKREHGALYLQRAALKCKNLVVSADETYISIERTCRDEESPQVPVLASLILAGDEFWWGCGPGEGWDRAWRPHTGKKASPKLCQAGASS